MNHKLKQYLTNNLWFGEAKRQHAPDRLPIIQSVIEGGQVFGVDVSHWQIPPVDFISLRDIYNCRFVIIKGCDGSLNTKHYDAHRQAAKDAGLVWGMYVWLYRPANVNMDSQINTWYTRYISDPPPMGLFIDCEWTTYGGVASNPNAADLRLAHDKWFAKSGTKAITYTAPGYANSYLNGFDWTREELWVAHYGVTVPTLPKGAPEYTFHQYTSTFKFNGVNLDGNRFNGTLADFQERYGVTTPPNGGTMNGRAKEKLGKTVATYYQATAVNKATRTIAPYSEIEFVEIVPDTRYPNDPNYQWFKLPDGLFTHWKYPRDGGAERFTILSMPQDDPQQTGDMTANLIFKSDGTVSGTWTEQ